MEAKPTKYRNVCLFEDTKHSDLKPLSHCRPAFDIRCGIYTPLERTRLFFSGANLSARVRPGFEKLALQCYGLGQAGNEPVELFINASALLGSDIAASIETFQGRDCVFIANGAVAACLCSSDGFRSKVIDAIGSGEIDAVSGSADVMECDVPFLAHAWDAVRHNSTMLHRDAKRFMPGCAADDAVIAPSVEIVDPRKVSIGSRARIGPGVVIDASDGPVIIEDDAVVMPQAVIIGPAFIGRGSRIKIAAKIYEGTSIGPVCKIGGEVEESVFHSYANKQHEGFVGHSYLAPWTNLGADTNTSDLKNTYSPVAMTIEGRKYETGMQFLGIVAADHSKSAINTMFNTGTCIGVGCNVFGAGFPPKFLPSFSWGGAETLEEYDINRFLETARIVMKRRGIELHDTEVEVYRNAFDNTAMQREKFQ
jgi:UDP-N-acetylglucosamine diphosphorylase/glucosamine-1-phosphate N-acetyltransferase